MTFVGSVQFVYCVRSVFTFFFLSGFGILLKGHTYLNKPAAESWHNIKTQYRMSLYGHTVFSLVKLGNYLYL